VSTCSRAMATWALSCSSWTAWLKTRASSRTVCAAVIPASWISHCPVLPVAAEADHGSLRGALDAEDVIQMLTT
jgi:hypothetical protein